MTANVILSPIPVISLFRASNYGLIVFNENYTAILLCMSKIEVYFQYSILCSITKKNHVA